MKDLHKLAELYLKRYHKTGNPRYLNVALGYKHRIQLINLRGRNDK